MSTPSFDKEFWEERWATVLSDHAEQIAVRPPNPRLVEHASTLPPGRALDAGCGHGAEALWLAVQGWQVTAVDFSEACLAHGRSTADALGAEVASRLTWVQGDLTRWAPEPDAYDLVSCLYVHMAATVEATVRRLATGVAPGGTLLLVGHRPIDPATGAATAAADQVQVSVDEAVEALDATEWTFVAAEDRPRAVAGTGVDAVICARRRS